MSRNYILDNGVLRAEISPLGGELCALYKNNYNYIWQGDSSFWDGHAPNLFPYIARLTEETYTLNGVPYKMGIHGFVKDRILTAENPSDETVTFVLESDTETLARYPFEFLYSVTYSVTGSKIDITYTVENRSKSAMYFGIGGHPGFNVPLEPGLKFEDYYLEFDSPCRPDRIWFSERNFVTSSSPYSLKDDRFIPLTHDLFDNDAIVLRNMAKTVCLKNTTGTRNVTVEYPDFQFLGIWHSPRTEAPFLCIEPWTSLPSRDGVVEEFTEQSNLIRLVEGETYKNVWSITFN